MNDTWYDLKLKLDLDYLHKKCVYDADTELLRLKREQFYRDNPNCPYKSMYIQVTAPPQKFEIRII